jgi:hypothetical protein
MKIGDGPRRIRGETRMARIHRRKVLKSGAALAALAGMVGFSRSDALAATGDPTELGASDAVAAIRRGDVR